MGEEEQILGLHELLKPHLLRRLKKDVLKQMPPKKEQVLRVELSNMQKDYYKKVLTRHYPVLAGSKQAGGQLGSKLNNVIMELRKCCNHPFLFEGAERKDRSRQAPPSRSTLSPRWCTPPLLFVAIVMMRYPVLASLGRRPTSS